MEQKTVALPTDVEMQELSMLLYPPHPLKEGWTAASQVDTTDGTGAMDQATELQEKLTICNDAIRDL